MGLLGVGLGLPLGSVAGGVLAHTLGLRAPFLCSAALIAFTAIVVPRISHAFTQAAQDPQCGTPVNLTSSPH